MSKEIKFRSYDPKYTSMYYCALSRGESCSDVIRVIKCGIVYYTLMQYTGLKDKNGVEIYEGDILKDSDGSILDPVSIKLYNNYNVCSIISGYYLGKGPSIMCEVIGNIYENPELMEKSK